MTWQTFAFVLIAGFAFSYAGWKFKTLIDLMKKQQGTGPKLDRLPERIKVLFLNVFGQSAVNRKQPIGIAHTIIFWGFMIITIGTLEQFASTIYSEWNFEFIGHTAYLLLVRIQDFFTTAILFAVGYALYRRVLIQPAGVGKSKDAMIVLIFTGSLMTAILIMNGFMILAHQPFFAEGMPVSRGIAAVLNVFNFTLDQNELLFTVWKWVHMVLVLGFAMYIPNSIHQHIVAEVPNSCFTEPQL